MILPSKKKKKLQLGEENELNVLLIELHLLGHQNVNFSFVFLLGLGLGRATPNIFVCNVSSNLNLSVFIYQNVWLDLYFYACPQH